MSAAEMLAGAAPERTPDWHSIDWKKVWRTVRRLQARIVKAVTEGRWNKVKALGLSAHALVQWPGSGHSASGQ
jgi:RNA-directed DNA polymerase